MNGRVSRVHIGHHFYGTGNIGDDLMMAGFLEALAARPGVIKSRNQLMDAAYPDDVFVDDRTVDSHIKRMRRKFRATDPGFGAIETLYGAGYSFTDG